MKTSALYSFLCSLPAVCYAALPITFHEINLKKYPLATCLDGTPGGFYFWPATSASSARKWVLHHGGGGWCATDVPITQWAEVDNCFTRSFTQLGSSKPKFYPRNSVDGWTIYGPEEMLVGNQATNPMMYDWNRISMIYCDGGSFAGRNEKPLDVNGTALHFRGAYIREAIQDTLLQEYGLDKATDVVVGGTSAGGLATYLHLDQWRSAIPKSAFVAGLPDGGFFLDWDMSKPAGAVSTYAHELRSDFTAFNASAGLHPDCILHYKAHGKDPARCYFAEHTAPFIKTPIFALQSTVDLWQANNILGNDTDAEKVNDFRLHLTARLQTNFFTNPTRGGFVDSCLHHCGRWDVLTVNATRSKDAFTTWFTEQRAAWEKNEAPQLMAWWQHEAFPCKACCGPPALSSNISGTYPWRQSEVVTLIV